MLALELFLGVAVPGRVPFGASLRALWELPRPHNVVLFVSCNCVLEDPELLVIQWAIQTKVLDSRVQIDSECRALQV